MHIEYTEDYDGNVMACPNCGVGYLHQMKIEVFDREEDKRGIHVIVENECVATDYMTDRNPSLRRQGLLVHFVCETCPAKPILRIAQHKGHTLIEIEPNLP